MSLDIRRRLIRNIWRTNGRMNFPLNGLILYAPLWHPQLNTNPIHTLVTDSALDLPLTVTGTTWGVTGRVMDGDDKLKSSTANWRSTDSTGSIIAWVEVDDNTANSCILSSCDEAGTKYYVQLTVQGSAGIYIAQRANDTADIVRLDVIPDNNTWFMIAAVSSGTAYSLYYNNTTPSSQIITGTNSGDWFADTSNRDNVVIGRVETSSPGSNLSGTLGEIWYYNRALSASEVYRMYYATKWRYV